jgi:predicted nucleic acid-binding protein
VAAEGDVVVSQLARLEAGVQLKAGWMGGDYSKTRYREFMNQLAAFAEFAPFRFVPLPGSVFATAIRQDAEAATPHLRALDRLHLAAMEELGIARLMTNDASRAAGARALKYQATVPL